MVVVVVGDNFRFVINISNYWHVSPVSPVSLVSPVSPVNLVSLVSPVSPVMVSILLYCCATYSQKEKFPKSHDLNGFIDKNPGRNATLL